ncbi:MAG: hypothetical protein OFPI_18070 [Osedax symbiont Rs2]|nr:MAG: hypothetical protein OFPI_18070 [Osedax symbiont Rs2]
MLKTIALAQYPEQHCGPLSGSDWALFLQSCVASSKSLNGECFSLLAKSYESQVALDTQQRSALYHATKNWISQHQVGLINIHPAAEQNELATSADASIRENKLV